VTSKGRKALCKNERGSLNMDEEAIRKKRTSIMIWGEKGKRVKKKTRILSRNGKE